MSNETSFSATKEPKSLLTRSMRRYGASASAGAPPFALTSIAIAVRRPSPSGDERRIPSNVTAGRRSLRRRLAVVALGPFGEDALALRGHPPEIVLDHRRFGVGRIVRRCCVDAGISHDSVVLPVHLV